MIITAFFVCLKISDFCGHTYYSFPHKQYDVSYNVDREEYCNLDSANRRQLPPRDCVAFPHQY